MIVCRHYQRVILGWWELWRRALTVEVLGRLVSFQILEQKVKDLWKLEDNCELVVLDKAYYLVCFYSKANYLKVLRGGSWIVLGHYLSIMKWGQIFIPTRTI